jgi:hypothetical protein
LRKAKDSTTLVFANENPGQSLSAIIVYVSGLSSKGYADDPARILTRFEVCPLTDERHALVRNGGYVRWVWVDGQEVRCRVFRKWCRTCRVSFTLLPLCVIARWQYPRELVVARLTAALEGTSCRSREFMVEQGVLVPPLDSDASWSDQLDAVSIRPCYQLLARWTRELAGRAARLVPSLTLVCAVLGVDLNGVASAVSGLRVTHPGMSPLPIAVGLLRAIRGVVVPEAQESLKSIVSELVMCLARRQLPPSHGVLRASGRRLAYDSLVI